jgi:hypothetical protein
MVVIIERLAEIVGDDRRQEKQKEDSQDTNGSIWISLWLVGEACVWWCDQGVACDG